MHYAQNYTGIKPHPIMLSFFTFLPIMGAQKCAYYAQYYAHDHCNYATVCMDDFND